METDDGTLLAQIREGSDRAFNLLIDRHQQAVRGFLRRLLASADDAEDIAQETFLAVWEGASGFRGGSSVRSWLCAIAWRKAKSAQRSWFRGRARETDWRADSGLDLGESAAPAEDQLAVRQALHGPANGAARGGGPVPGGGLLPTRRRPRRSARRSGTVKSHVTRGRARLLEVFSEIPGGVSWQDGMQGARL